MAEIDLFKGLNEKWKSLLKGEFTKSYCIDLNRIILDEYSQKKIYPPLKEVFNAYNFSSPQNIKVVIIGQDPYHGKGQAHGFSFSVKNGIKHPPSLKNIFKELTLDDAVEFETPLNGNLSKWAEQGVFLLNATLTVPEATPNAHQKLGWSNFTDETIKLISDQLENIVFMLWGNFAIQKSELIDESKHLILTAPHPSPFSAHKGFFGCNHFSKCNSYLKKNNLKPIDWNLKDNTQLNLAL